RTLRKVAWSTVPTGGLSMPGSEEGEEEIGDIADRQDGVRRDEVTGDPDQEVGQVLPADEAASGVVHGERRCGSERDEAFDFPLAGERAPACALVVGERGVFGALAGRGERGHEG